MKQINITTTFSVFDSKDELPEDVKNLMDQAIEIRKRAYAPYSRFRVGAAIFLDNGKTVLGSNQESAAYPSGLCAERVAIFQAGAIYPDAKILKNCNFCHVRRKTGYLTYSAVWCLQTIHIRI